MQPTRISNLCILALASVVSRSSSGRQRASVVSVFDHIFVRLRSTPSDPRRSPITSLEAPIRRATLSPTLRLRSSIREQELSEAGTPETSVESRTVILNRTRETRESNRVHVVSEFGRKSALAAADEKSRPSDRSN